MASGKEVRAGKAFVEVGLRDRVRAGLDQIAGRLRAFSSLVSHVGGGLIGAGASIAVPLAAAVLQFSRVGDAVHKLAARTGLSAEAVTELGHAANLSGTDLNTLEVGVRRMQQTISDAARGSAAAQNALAALGMTAADLAGLAPDQQFDRLADGLAAIPDPAQRAATAMGVFGKRGTQLIPLMEDGAAGIRAMRDQARALGLTMSTQTANSAALLNDALSRMWSAVKAVTLNLGAALAPAVTAVAEIIARLAAHVTQFISDNQQLVVAIAAVAVGLSVAGAALLGIGGLAAVAAVALSGIATVIGGLGTVLTAVLSPLGLIAAALIGGLAAWLAWTDSGRATLSILQQAFQDIWSLAEQTFGGLVDALAAGDLQLAARILWAGLRTIWFTGLEGLNQAWSQITDAAASAWQSLRQTATDALVFVGEIFAQLPQWIAAPLMTVGNTFAAVFGWIGQQAHGLFALLSETFAGLGAALASGDFALAAEIAWNSLQLAFAQGIGWVTNAWTEFTTGLASLFDGVVTSIRQTWTNVSTWIARQMLNLVGMVQSLVAKLAEIDPTGLSDKLKAAIDIDVEGAIRILEEDSQRFNQGLDQAKSSRDDQRVQAMQQQLAETEKQLADLREARQQALAKAGSLAKDDTESPLAGAMSELERALAEAASARKLFDADAAQSQLASAGGIGTLPGLGGSAGVAGTFNAAVAGLLGRAGDDPGERTADAVESMDEKLTDIRDDLRGRPALAFDS